jgi:hypothetical protein
MRILLLALLLYVSAWPPAPDQESLPSTSPPLSFYTVTGEYGRVHLQQEVTAASSGLVTDVSLYAAQPGTVEITVCAGTPWCDADAATPIMMTWFEPGWQNVSVERVGVSVEKGDIFTIAVTGSSASPSMSGSAWYTNAQYHGGRLWVWLDGWRGEPGVMGCAQRNQTFDLAFRTWVTGDFTTN